MCPLTINKCRCDDESLRMITGRTKTNRPNISGCTGLDLIHSSIGQTSIGMRSSLAFYALLGLLLVGCCDHSHASAERPPRRQHKLYGKKHVLIRTGAAQLKPAKGGGNDGEMMIGGRPVAWKLNLPPGGERWGSGRQALGQLRRGALDTPCTHGTQGWRLQEVLSVEKTRPSTTAAPPHGYPTSVQQYPTCCLHHTRHCHPPIERAPLSSSSLSGSPPAGGYPLALVLTHGTKGDLKSGQLPLYARTAAAASVPCLRVTYRPLNVTSRARIMQVREAEGSGSRGYIQAVQLTFQVYIPLKLEMV